tara:strand:+ start:35 stop:520 length:486 start_codon:yes stop_codon:yes gene_type:complete
MKKLILISSLLISFDALAEIESPNIEFFDEIKSCNELVGIMHERWSQKEGYFELFKDGRLLGCTDNELPDEWVKSRVNINQVANTVCEIPCNIRPLPILVDPVERIGHIFDDELILIHERVEVHDNLLDIYKDSPWYKYWYSFYHQGKKLYIHKDNVTFID